MFSLRKTIYENMKNVIHENDKSIQLPPNTKTLNIEYLLNYIIYPVIDDIIRESGFKLDIAVESINDNELTIKIRYL